MQKFPDGGKYFTGNRCERGIGGQKKESDTPNIYQYKYERLFQYYEPLEEPSRGTIGLPTRLYNRTSRFALTFYFLHYQLIGWTLLAVYAAGLGLPFLAVAAFFARLSPAVNFLKRHAERIERIMGLMLWTIGLLMLTGGFSAFSFWLLENVPVLAEIG